MPCSTLTEKKAAFFYEDSESKLDIPEQYSELLRVIQPVAIADETEYQRINGWIDSIEQLGENANSDQVQIAKLLSVLIEKYEDKYIEQRWSSPESVLRGLMEERSLQQKDIVHIFGGHKSNVSSVLSGKRGISVEQAKQLGALFQVSFSLFL